MSKDRNYAEQVRRYLLAKARVFMHPGDESKAAYDLAFGLLVGHNKPACFRGKNHVLTDMEIGFEQLLASLAENGCPNPDALTVFKFYNWIDRLEKKFEAMKPTPHPMPLNDSNFLIWYPDGENQFIPALPRPFVREPEVMSPVVWLVAGETVSFYINSGDNSAPAGVITLLDENGGSHAVVQSLSSIAFPGGSHVYGSFTVPAVAEGFARLKLGTLTSQYCWLSSADKASGLTAVVKFRNGDRLQNFRYRYLPDDYFQQFRIRLAVKNEEPEINKQTYRSATTGKTRHLYSEPRQIITFQTPEYDRNGHRAIVSMMEHDTLLINGQPFAFSAAYKANSNEGDVLTTGEFALSDENYATLHRS